MKTLSTILSIILFSLTVNAQKLPTEQQGSLRAPANIKVDGKATEWDNKFQAFNKHVDFFYNMANDDHKLYLTIQVTEPSVIRRICSAGITVLINKSGKKNEKEGMAVTYPVFENNNRFTPMLKYNSSALGSIVNIKNTGIESNSSKQAPLTDSAINVTNKNMAAKAKLIRTSGFKNIDTLISVYNADGIKATALFDHKMVYTLELSIDLKQLDLSVNNADKFTYELRVNEVEQRGINITKDPAGNITMITVTKGDESEMGQAQTDFWSEYTLAQ